MSHREKTHKAFDSTHIDYITHPNPPSVERLSE